MDLDLDLDLAFLLYAGLGLEDRGLGLGLGFAGLVTSLVFNAVPTIEGVKRSETHRRCHCGDTVISRMT